MRAFLCSAAVLALWMGAAIAVDEAPVKERPKTANKGKQATIANVNAQKHTITLRMKDESGEDVTKTFKLTEYIRMMDSSGNEVAIDLFRSGDQVLVVQEEDKITELRQAKASRRPVETSPDENPTTPPDTKRPVKERPIRERPIRDRRDEERPNDK